jgi:hypothetical protein
MSNCATPPLMFPRNMSTGGTTLHNRYWKPIIPTRFDQAKREWGFLKEMY